MNGWSPSISPNTPKRWGPLPSMCDRWAISRRRIDRAKKADRTSVIVISTDAHTWTPGDAWWDVGVPEVSASDKVRAARADHMAQKHKQRAGV